MFDTRNVAGHMVDFFLSSKKYEDLIELNEWLDSTVVGLMIPGKISYLTRYIAMIKTIKAMCYELIGNHEKMMSEIALAIEHAKAFDVSPVYDAYTNIKFVYGPKKDIPITFDEKEGDTLLVIKQILEETYNQDDLGFTKKELQAIKRVQEYMENLI